ncbi:importin-beta N-terminal domain-containing protein [Cryptosporidium felis]|nr:importin-beta N-terminal domain-containing protein [Cryptosporidium felis]
METRVALWLYSHIGVPKNQVTDGSALPAAEAPRFPGAGAASFRNFASELRESRGAAPSQPTSAAGRAVRVFLWVSFSAPGIWCGAAAFHRPSSFSGSWELRDSGKEEAERPGRGPASDAQSPTPRLPEFVHSLSHLNLSNCRGDVNQQKQAHEVLLPLTCNLGCLTQLQALLAQSSNPHALMFAATGLSKLFTSCWAQIPDSQKEETKTFLLNYLYKCGPDMLRSAPYLVGHFVRLLSQLVKFGLLDSLSPRPTITDQVGQFLSASTPHWIIGLIILTTLTQEMQTSTGLYFAKYRRAAILFRDTSLPVIFQIAIKTLRQLHLGSISAGGQQEEYRLLRQVLQLTLSCMAYDFMGTVPDETSEEQNTVMIPHSWTILREEYIPIIFFEIYARCCSPSASMPDCASICLQCLILYSSIRRSFFPTQADRTRSLAALMTGTAGIIQTKMGLEHEACYHELCRLLGKLNTANQLTELSSSEAFGLWIDQVYNFTIKSLEEWSVLPNSKHYLLGLWSHMVIPLLYQGDRAPANLEKYIHHITITFIQSRMKLAEAIAQGSDVEDPLESEVARTEQLDVLAQLSRCQYHETAEYIVQLFEQVTEAAKNGSISQDCFITQITWCVYMHGALIGGHSIKLRRPLMPGSSSSGGGTAGLRSEPKSQVSHHVLNGKLARLVFGLSQQTDQLAETPESLELAYLYFLEQFRKVCLGDYAKQFIQPETEDATLASILGVQSDDDVLSLIISKIGRNLQAKSGMESVVQKTLSLFHELAAGISIVQYTDRTTHLIVSGRLLLKNEQVRRILRNHASPEFAFLSVPRYGRHRTSYYFTLAKLLFLDAKEEEPGSQPIVSFEDFMKPLENVFALIWDEVVLGNGGMGGPAGLNPGQLRVPLMALARDLRGICMACVSSESYNQLFGWLVNRPKQLGQSRIHLFTWAADKLWEDPDVMNALLKFMAEFVDNKSQRISFDKASPNGILLFKEVSSLVCTYGSRILSKPDSSFQNIYKEKYKGLATTLGMLCHALSGGYTNFGVFEVYQDQSLENALKLACRMCLIIPEHDLQSYIKSLKSYYEFLELATRCFMSTFITSIEPQSLAEICYSIESGLCAVDNVVLLACCATLDHLVSFIFSTLEKEKILLPNGMGLPKQRGSLGSDADEMSFEPSALQGSPSLGSQGSSPEGKAVYRFMTEQSNALIRIMQLMFNLITTGDLSTWTFSRSLLGMILLFSDEFQKIQQQLVSQQVDEKKAKYQLLIQDLLKGTDGTLSAVSKDAFTRNLHFFAHSIRSNSL